jgi:signal transduction histidine kinase
MQQLEGSPLRNTASAVPINGDSRTGTLLGLALASAYACFGVFWILVSDDVASNLAPTAEALEVAQRYKGVGFIVVSAVCLLLLVRYGYKRLRFALGAQAAIDLQASTRQLEVRVAERTEELRFVNQELDAFACTAAHDLKTPLNGIIGFIEILRIQYKHLLGSEGDRMTSVIQNSAERMAILIDDLLALSRVTTQELELERVDLAAIAAGVVDELRAREPGREVGVSIRSPMHILADEGLLRSLLANLIGNAWKFTAKEASAHIEVGCDDTDEGWVVHFVRDNGAGFDMNDAAKVFEPFHRFHSTQDFAGTGVGLATCQRIVRRHGGSIWISSAPGKGTSVYFSLSQTGVKGHPPCVPKGSFFATFA